MHLRNILDIVVFLGGYWQGHYFGFDHLLGTPPIIWVLEEFRIQGTSDWTWKNLSFFSKFFKFQIFGIFRRMATNWVLATIRETIILRIYNIQFLE